MTEIETLQNAIAALETQRATLGDALVDVALAPLREKLVALREPSDSPEQQRKLVSVLFADICESTQLGQGREPDEILELMDGALQRLAGPVEEHGGRVSRFMGDGLMAIFGLPASLESDALQAVRAGLKMLAVTQALGQELERAHGIHGFDIRAGISTGLVASGGDTEAEDTIGGLPVNLGARLQSAAPPGGLLISHTTYQQVRGAFEIEPQEPIAAKGFPEPVPVYLVRSARPRTFRSASRSAHGAETRMVGRDVELWQLQRAFEQVLTRAQTHLVTVIGEAGIGKSRLLYEFDRWRAAQSSPGVPFKARASEQTSGIPFSLMRDLVAYRFGILFSDSVTVARQKLEAGLAEFFADEPEMKAHFVGSLLGYDLGDSPHLAGVRDDARQLRQRGLFYLTQFFAAATKQAPTVILLDDIHWADQPSLDALTQLARDCPELRLLIVCLSRPTLLEHRPDWAEPPTLGDAQSVQIPLAPLPREATHQLVREILHTVETLPPSLLEDIVTSAEGNPFYTEELIEVLVDDGVIRKDDSTGAWHSDPARLDRLRVPSTLMAVLQARLDHLPLAERIVVQQASVVGRTFWGAALQALQGTSLPPTQVLADLSRRELIHRRDESTFAGTDEYHFRHALMRETAYNTVLIRTRRAYHGLVASWLVDATQASKRSDEVPGLIAEHYERAGEAAEAAAWYLRAGEGAQAQGATAEARIFLDRALRLLPKDEPERRWRALLARDEVLGTLGEMEARFADDEALVALARELKDDDKLAAAYQHQGYSLGIVGQYQEQLEAYQMALDASRRAGNRRLEAILLGQEVEGLTRLGREERAGRVAEEALALAREIGDENVLVRNLTNASLFFSEYGDIGRAAQLLENQVAINSRLANHEGEAVGLSNLGYNYVRLGMYDRAIDALKRAVELALGIGHRLHAAYGRLNLALAYLRNGDLDRAVDALEASIPALKALHDRFGQAAAQCYTALVREVSGEHARAAECFATAHATLVEIGVQGGAHDAAAGLVRCLLALGRIHEARQEAEALWEHLSDNGPGGMEFPVLAFQTCADLFDSVGDLERSRTAVEQGYRELLDRAEKIGDPAWRYSFLENVPEHRTITARWRGESK
jgi:predicted ATPase/class 3 adenylate cyclase